MRMGKLCLLLIIGLLAGFTQTVFSNAGPFSCWHCESLTQSNCGENFDVNGIEPLNCEKTKFPAHLLHIIGTLNQNVTGCMKTTTEINGEIIVRRSCFFGDVKNINPGCTPDPSSLIRHIDNCEVCEKHLCNTSSSLLRLYSHSLLEFLSITIILNIIIHKL
ncbi:uncharacterized protein LOC129608310 isoform X1 [Condylostylus longicornis]|uniref:uncharacterized protein LOC129608310 isoform X1 n=1 Tax=Condylostylus longicornis TaxID=2530218 RepID=UPI00244DCC3F|nr:uncharacterized protein LOC129608310 isoform X1 [Condylostylus longicornis]XP_055375724.1 uncharacterized protein LOC129608310 isoform X1 [Condylostylus longicornis]